MRILFADDQVATRELFSQVFKLREHTAVMCADGAEAVDALQSSTFDVVVLDIEMPVMDGLTATRKMRELPHGQQVPIVLFTGHPYDMKTARAVGADLILHKPFLPFEFLEQLEIVRQQKMT